MSKLFHPLLFGPAIALTLAVATIDLSFAQVEPPENIEDYAAAEDLYLKRVEDDLYLRRCYPDFAHLCADGGFFRWAETLYGEATRAIRSAAAAAESEA